MEDDYDFVSSDYQAFKNRNNNDENKQKNSINRISRSYTNPPNNNIRHTNTRLEKEIDQGFRNMIQENMYEDKLVNNSLLAVIFIQIFIIISFILLIMFKINLFAIYKNNDQKEELMTFSFLKFESETQEYYWYGSISERVIKDEKLNKTITVCENSEKSKEMGLNITRILEDFDIHCFDFIGLMDF